MVVSALTGGREPGARLLNALLHVRADVSPAAEEGVPCGPRRFNARNLSIEGVARCVA